jgi:hypothetical protein
MVVVLGLGLLVAPVIMAQQAPAEPEKVTVVAEKTAAPAEAKKTAEKNAPEVKSSAVTAETDTPVSAVTAEKTAEALPVVTPETKPENAPEAGAETTPVVEKPSESPVAATPAPSSEPSSSMPAVASKQPVATEEPAAKKQKTDSESEEMVGIDTVNVDEPAGNWLYKRLYWERAEDKYQKIKELMAVIFDARSKFFEQRVKLDKDIFDPLYTLASFRRGELSGILKDLLEDIEKQSQHKNELDDNARVLFAKVEANKERLEEVKKEIEFVGKIDSAVDEAINTLIGLLNQGRNFEMQAWGDFKAISRELSDKKARDLFYRIDTYWRNIKDIQVYITTKLTEHMNYLASSAQQHADTVKGLLKELEAQGFVLKEQVDALEKAKSVGADGTEKDDEAAIKAKKKSSGFFATIGKGFSWIAQPFVAIAKALWHTITIPFNYFFGDKKPVQPESIPAAPEVGLEDASAKELAKSESDSASSEAVLEEDSAQKQVLPEAS